MTLKHRIVLHYALDAISIFPRSGTGYVWLYSLTETPPHGCLQRLLQGIKSKSITLAETN